MLARLLGRFRSLFRADAVCLSDGQFGRWAENQAAKYLKRNGLRILARNFRLPIGEIDIVAADGEWLVFVEVKGERNLDGRPELKIMSGQHRKLIRTAKAYISRYRLRNRPARFDVVTVQTGPNGQVRIEHYPDAFQAK